MYLTDGKHKITVPRHDIIQKGTLLAIIQQSGLSREEFLNLLKRYYHSRYRLKHISSLKEEDWKNFFRSSSSTTSIFVGFPDTPDNAGF